jgi:hypothetical protein
MNQSGAAGRMGTNFADYKYLIDDYEAELE